MAGSMGFDLPPGFRFHPTDEELVMHYLCRKCTGQPISVPVIAEIDLYKFDPWELPAMANWQGEKEWYFFSPRDRKYPNGSRPNRGAGDGYWKATGVDKPVGSPKTVAIKKALVFYAGKPPNGVKTDWIMHEYRLADVDRSARKKNNSLRLDDWVLCRIYNKKGIIEKHTSSAATITMTEQPKAVKPAKSGRRPSSRRSQMIQTQLGPKAELYDDYLLQLPADTAGMLCFETSEEKPGQHMTGSSHVSSANQHTDSSGSDRTTSSDREVESQPNWEDVVDWDEEIVIDAALFPPESPKDLDAFFGDMFTYMERPYLLGMMRNSMDCGS